VRECPGGCIPKDRTIKANVGGYDLEWADVDMDKCDWVFQGGAKLGEGEQGDYFPTSKSRGGKYKASDISPFETAPKHLYNSGKAICGARGCTRACMISLENRGVLKNKFENPFRTSKPWKVDWSQGVIDNGYVAPYDNLDFDSPNARAKNDTETD
jgi:hypothetical protein